jgi:PncC family amidohydrolase
VSYASSVKFDVLGVAEGPVVSDDAVRAMSEGACRVLNSDVGIAVTGVAGPDEQEGIPVGTVFMATTLDGVTETSMAKFPFNREQTRQFTVITVLDHLRRRLLAR